MEQPYIKHTTESIPISGSPKTPAKKRRTTQTPRKARLNEQEDISWTVIRCNRLLRSIISRIHILRRLSENDFATQYQRTPKAKRKRDISVDPVEKLGSKLATLQTPSRGDDPEWFPTTGKKDVPRKYGGRGRGRPKNTRPEWSESSTAADVGFRTPYIKKLLRPDAALSPADDAYSTSNRIGQMSRKGRQDTIQPNTHAERALRTLLESFDTLLDATDPKTRVSRRGASSLLSMCLRKVPAYIDFEQKYAEEEEDDYGFDAAEAVYLELESMGNGSWHGLREVARAHAVKLIMDAMEERMWPLKSLDALMDICTKHRAVAEAQQMLKTWLVSSEGKIEGGLDKFVDCCVKLDYKGFMFSTLKDQLVSGKITCSQLGLARSLWTELPTSLLRQSCRVAVADFLVQYAAICPVVSKELTEDAAVDFFNNVDTIRTMMTLITTMGTADAVLKISDTKTTNSLATQVHQMAVQLAVGVQNLKDEVHIRTAYEVTDFFLTSSLMVYSKNSDTIAQHQHADAPSFNALTGLIEVVDYAQRQFHSARQKDIDRERASFICKIVRTLESVEKAKVQDTIRQITTNLLHATSWNSTGKAQSPFKQLAVEIALQWAEYRGDNESFVFAEEIQRRALGKDRSSTSPRISDASDNGFKWEEEIGEWVAVTPCQRSSTQGKSRQPSILSQDSGIGMSESDTPSKKAIDYHEQQPKGAELLGVIDQESAPREGEGEARSTSNSPMLGAQHNVEAVSSPLAKLSSTQSPDQTPEDLQQLSATPCKPKSRGKKPPAKRGRPPKKRVLEDHDELSMSPDKATLPRPARRMNSRESSCLDDATGDDLLLPAGGLQAKGVDDRDELAMTPKATQLPQTPAPKKTGTKPWRKPKSKAVEPTPARMTLRSQRKPRPAIVETSSERASDDELGV